MKFKKSYLPAGYQQNKQTTYGAKSDKRYGKQLLQPKNVSEQPKLAN